MHDVNTITIKERRFKIQDVILYGEKLKKFNIFNEDDKIILEVSWDPMQGEYIIDEFHKEINLYQLNKIINYIHRIGLAICCKCNGTVKGNSLCCGICPNCI